MKNTISLMLHTALALAVFIVSPAVFAADVPRPEHPRPDFNRGENSWQNLNGQWDFALDPGDAGLDEKWQERDSLPQNITVPYPVQSELSGIENPEPPAVMWYLKSFDLDRSLPNRDSIPTLPYPVKSSLFSPRLMLNFGAVDYHATVWLNGKKLGEHYGGYTPFTLEITRQVKDQGNRLVVRVEDSLDRMQVRGKQSPSGKPHGIMYTPVSGIWQTVWIEAVPGTYVKGFKFEPASDLTGGTFTLDIQGSQQDIVPRVYIYGSEQALENNKLNPLGQVVFEKDKGTWQGLEVTAWSPDNPKLYPVMIEIESKTSGDVIDRAYSYVGVRTVESRGGKIYLNGEPFYQKLLLDQGYFPGGIYTPKDDEIMRRDVEMFKEMGFNGLRKHQKVEDPRFLYWCDKLGLVVWEEMPSLGFGVPRRVPAWAMQRFDEEWMDVIARDFNHPSIIAWAVFNENWGIYEMLWHKKTKDWAYAIVSQTRKTDPTRLVVDNSGGLHFDTDVFDFHQYMATVEDTVWLYENYQIEPGDSHKMLWWLMHGLSGKSFLHTFYPGATYQGQPIILSEYGGFGFYRTEGDQSLLDQYRDYTLAINDYPNIVGFCYTQPYDVQQEANGLLTEDRQPKIPLEKIKEINDKMGR